MGGAVLMQLGFTYLASFALSLFCAVFDKSGSLAKLIFGDDLVVSYALNTFFEFITYFVFFTVIIKVLNQSISQTCALGLPDRKGLALPCIFISLSTVLYGVVFLNLLSSFTENVFHAVPYEPEFAVDSFTPFTFIFVLINSALIPALIEEFTFRGAIIGIFRRYGDIGAIFISTIMFSLVHRNFVQIPYTFMFGLGLGLTRIITNSIWPCIIAHFINNAFVTVISVMPDSLSVLSLPIQFAYLLIFAVLGVIYFVKLNKSGVFASLSKPPYNKTSGADFCKALFAPLNVIAIIVLLIFAFSRFKAV